jgi:hypothetical protein
VQPVAGVSVAAVVTVVVAVDGESDITLKHDIVLLDYLPERPGLLSIQLQWQQLHLCRRNGAGSADSHAESRRARSGRYYLTRLV